MNDGDMGGRMNEAVVLEAPSKFSEDVEINDAPPHIRSHLTRSALHESLEKEFGISLLVKGRYYSPGRLSAFFVDSAPRDLIY